MSERDRMDEKEAKRRKQVKRMTKLLSKAWELPNAEAFQQSPKLSDADHVYDLSSLGKNLDEGIYKLGRSGWEKFAKDIGGVYNQHIKRGTQNASVAKHHLEKVKSSLERIDESLGSLAGHFCPEEPRKRKIETQTVSGGAQKRKAQKSSFKKNVEDMTIGERESQAMEDLFAYVEQVGGAREQVLSFRSRASKRSDGRFDVNFFNSEGRRFRSMVDVGRFLSLVKSKSQPGRKVQTKRPPTSREAESEKKKLRKELDKLMKAHQKASKALDDFRNEREDSLYPIDDALLMEEELEAGKSVLSRCKSSAARIPDVESFPGLPEHCVADTLMVWDFLCTFSRALSLTSIDFDGFVASLTFVGTSGTADDDILLQPPVYLAEAHLGLMKLLLMDRSSDEWWWSILEDDESSPADNGEIVGPIDKSIPVIKIDMDELLSFQEDPLITASWLQALEDIRNQPASAGTQIRQAVRNATTVVVNKWVKAYLRKSLVHWKPTAAGFTKRAILWLIDRVREARPDLWGRNVRTDQMAKQRSRVIEDTMKLMARLDESVDRVTVDDLPSDDESEDEEDSDDEAQDAETPAVLTEPGEDDKDKLVRSPVPVKPVPTLVDLLLPPSKPHPQSELVSAFSWPSLAGACVSRIIHFYKRQRNVVDDRLREKRELPPMKTSERRLREASCAPRVLSECFSHDENGDPVERATEHLCKGESYLALSSVERLCVLKTLVEAAYDTSRVNEVVDGNFKARINAVKALEVEERRAKREFKEETAAMEVAARDKLASEARERFLEVKRAELRKLNEYSDEVISELTDEELVELDEDTKAEFMSLPKESSFNKSEVKIMVKKMQEETAFETNCLTIVKMEDLDDRDMIELDAMEKKEAVLRNAAVDRETSRRLDRVRRDIEDFKEAKSGLSELRESAVEVMKEAIEEGTIKALRSAIRVAKQARLTGRDEDTGNVWALGLVRDVALELKAAEGRKRVVEAQRDLVAKRNKCFIRTEPLAFDRFKNRFWHFESDDGLRVWAEAEFLRYADHAEAIKDGFVGLLAGDDDITICAQEEEGDFLPADSNSDNAVHFKRFSRQEFHTSGFSCQLAKRFWGCHASEAKLRVLMKNLDGRGRREFELKGRLKETLEASRQSATNDADLAEGNGQISTGGSKPLQTRGDEIAFREAVSGCDGAPSMLGNNTQSAINQRVRIREVIDGSRDPPYARYKNGSVVGWRERRISHDEVPKEAPPVWVVSVERGGELVLLGSEVVESMVRFIKWSTRSPAYSELDAVYLGYRNSLGRYCGRAADAGVSATPASFARMLLKREQELYPAMKRTSYSNSAGKSGARNTWITDVRENCVDITSARRALLTMESTLYELVGGIGDGEDFALVASSKLSSATDRFDIELESIEKNSSTVIWNSRETRAIFRQIVSGSTTTSFLALALDLLCRNCRAFLDTHKLPEVNEPTLPPPRRTTRRMNAWQQANQDWYG